jgi:hypothetical protein
MMDRCKSGTTAWVVSALLASPSTACGDDAEVADDTDGAVTDDGAVATTNGSPTGTNGADDSATDDDSGPPEPPEPPSYPEDELEVWELRTDGFAPPVTETWYSCFSFSIELDRLHHVIGFEPVVSHPVIHHYILSLANQPTEVDPQEPCYEWQPRMIWGWAPGIAPMALPDEAGILVGDNPGATANFILQVHYNNPLLEPVEELFEGIDIIATPNLRPHDAFVWSQGDIANISIPPGDPSYVHTARCTESLTTSQLDHPIHVFASFLHAHEIGVAITSEQYRGGDLLTEIASQVPYDFNTQQFQPTDVLIRPGDEIETRCTYDSTGREGQTVGGVASRDEMCINFMMYYPRIRSERCGSI